MYRVFLINRQRLRNLIKTSLKFGSCYLTGLINILLLFFRYIHLIPHSSTRPEISTLILCAPDEPGLDELKLLCNAVLQSLKQLLYQPFLVPGAGCFETIMAASLLENVQKFEEIQELDCSKRTW